MLKKSSDRRDLSKLVDRYQKYSVVSEIEHNLLDTASFFAPVNELVIADLYAEENYDLTRYQSLEKSLKEDGFLMPLIAVKVGDQYEIINGVKRLLLAKKIGMVEIPVVKAELEWDRKVSYILENIQEEGDSPYVKTYAFSVLKEKYHFSVEEIASRSHLSSSQVKNLLRLQKLPKNLKQGLISFELSYGEARSLLNLPKEVQNELFAQIQKGSLSCRDLEKAKRSYLGVEKKRTIQIQKNAITITFEDESEAKRQYEKLKRQFID